MAGNATELTILEPRYFVPEPCEVEVCDVVERVCEEVYGRESCLSFVFSGPHITSTSFTGDPVIEVAEVPLLGSSFSLATALIVTYLFWRK